MTTTIEEQAYDVWWNGLTPEEKAEAEGRAREIEAAGAFLVWEDQFTSPSECERPQALEGKHHETSMEEVLRTSTG